MTDHQTSAWRKGNTAVDTRLAFMCDLALCFVDELEGGGKEFLKSRFHSIEMYVEMC